MRIAVVGAGAVGGYFGGRLAAAGNEVCFIARGATLEALRSRGLQVESPSGDFTLAQVRATADPCEVGSVDAVVVAVKTWQVERVAATLPPLLGPETVILPLLNGVDAPGQLVAACGAQHVLGGTCRIVAEQLAPARIRHIGVEPFIALGELDARPSDRVQRLQAVLAAAGIGAHVPSDIHVWLWRKLLFIAPVSGLGALSRVPLGSLRAHDETRQVLEEAMYEVAAVAAAEGVELGERAVARTLAFLDGMPAESTPSMQRDIARGQPSELEAINGAVVRIGRDHGVATPVNRLVLACLLPLERLARRQQHQR